MDAAFAAARVLVVGGAGFIGSHTVDALLAAGARVRVLDNFSTGKPDNLAAHPLLEVVTGDMRDLTTVRTCMQDVSHVLHLAAQVSVVVSCEEPLVSAAHNITGFLNVLDTARRAGVQRFVHASSAAVYGAPAESPLAETSPTMPLSPYGSEKLFNDQYAAMAGELWGVSAMGMRYFNVYGPRQDPSSPYSGVISIFAERLRSGQALAVHGDGGQTRDFIYVGDVARANLAALASDATGVCNVGTGKSVTLLDLIAAMGEVAGCAPVVNHLPARTGDIRASATRVDRLREVLGIAAACSLRSGLACLFDSMGMRSR